MKPMQFVIKSKDSERVVPKVLDGPNRTMSDIDVSPEQAIAWTEVTSNYYDDEDWELFGMDTSGTPRHLGSWKSFGDEPPPYPPEGSPIAVNRTRAYLTAPMPYTLPSGQEDFYTSIVSAPLDGSAKLTVAVPDAYLPATGPQGLHYAKTYGVTRGMKEGKAELWVAPPDGGKHRLLHTEPLTKNQQVRGQCVAGDTLVWATGNGHEDVGHISIKPPNGPIKTIPLNQSAWQPGLSCTPDWIAWGGTSSGDRGQYLYSLTTHTLWKLGVNTVQSSIMMNGKTIAWSIPPAQTGDPVSYRVARWLHWNIPPVA